MSVCFIGGRNGSNIDDKILNIAFDRAKSEEVKNVFILVSEKYTYEMEKKLSASYISNVDENFKIRIVSFSTLGKMVFTNTGGLRLKKLSESSRRLILYKSIFNVSKNLKTFNTKSVGILDKIMDSILEFKNNNFSVEVVKSMIDSIENEGLKLKLQDFLLIYSEYENEIKNKYVDVDDSLNLFASKVENFEEIKNSVVIFNDFNDFTSTQMNVVKHLISNSLEVYFSFNTDFKDNMDMYVFYSSKRTMGIIESFCRENSIKIENRIEIPVDKIYSYELIHLEREFTKFKGEKFNKEVKDISICEFKNIHLEVEYTALKILELINKDYRYNEITVATRDLSSYDYIIERIFNDYGIEYFMDKKIVSKTNPIVVLLLSILDMKKSYYSYNSVFRYLKSGLINIDYEDICVLENFALENGIKGKKWFSEDFGSGISHNLENREDDSEEIEEKIKKLRAIRDRIFTPILKLHENLSGLNTVSNICKYLYEFTVDIDLQNSISNVISKFNKSEDLYSVKEYGQVWNIFISILDEMVEFIGDEKIGLDRFISLFESEFDSYELGIIPISLDKIFVTSVDRMKNPNTKVVFILGANDGVFPKVIMEDGLLTDLDKSRLSQENFNFMSDSLVKTREEQFLVYKAITTATEKLFVYYPIADFAGKSLRPSPVVKKICEIFPKLKVDNLYEFNFEDNVELLNSREVLFRFFANTIINTDHTVINDEDFVKLYNFLVADENYRQKVEMILSSVNYNNKSYNIRKFTSKLYSNKNFSVSRLEKFSSCPYSYFMSYGMNAERRKKLEFSAMDLGNYSHKILDEFSQSVFNRREKNIENIDIEFIKKKVVEISKEIINSNKKYILGSSEKFEYLSNRINENLTKILDIIVEQVKRGDFIPKNFEYSFNERNTPINFDINDGTKIKLIGKIDRVDIFKDEIEELIRIIDYKSSNKELQIDRIYAGIQLQLFIYMRVILQEKKNSKPSALLYSKFNLGTDELSNYGEFKELNEFEIRNKRLNSNKFSGFYIDDFENIKHLDKNIEETRKSDIYKMSLKKDGTLGSSNSSITSEEFNILNEFVYKKAIELCNEIYGGSTSISPYKLGDETPCKFCEYRSICKFDITLNCNSYKKLQKLNKDNRENILKKMKSKNKEV